MAQQLMRNVVGWLTREISDGRYSWRSAPESEQKIASRNLGIAKARLAVFDDAYQKVKSWSFARIHPDEQVARVEALMASLPVSPEVFDWR